MSNYCVIESFIFHDTIVRISTSETTMKNGSYSTCGSTEVLSDLRLRVGEGYPPFVDIC